MSLKFSAAQNIYTDDKTGLDKLLNDYYEENLELFPVTATSIGDNRYNDKWPNYISQTVINELKDFYGKYKENLSKINRNNLSENDKINYDVLEWECKLGLEGLQHKDYLMPLNPIFSQHLFVPQMASGNDVQPFGTAKDYDNWLKRLNEFLIYCDSAMANMKTGMKLGYTLPKALTELMIPQFEDFSKGPAEEHPFFAPINNFAENISENEKARVTKDYKNFIEQRVIPVYKKITDFLKNEYLQYSRETAGIYDTPLGKDYYAYTVKLNTTTELSPEEIYETGLKEVERIKSEMETAKEQTGFKGSLKDFFEHVKNNKELMPFTKPEEVLANFESIHNRMKPSLSKLFTRQPESPLEIRRMAEYLENSYPPFYVAGTMDGKRPGVFYVPIPDAKKYNTYTDEVLFLHEAVPGHHYQNAWQSQDTSLPPLRKLVWYVGMGEGWALYTESLGKELGLYTDPYQYFGMLTLEMIRAARLVLDVGLHLKGWTREQAIEYLRENTPSSEQVIVSSVERYMGNPGQSLGYKIGQLKIMELRKKAQDELKEKFNIAQFHEQVLSVGSVPLKVLENIINSWIEKEKHKK